MRYFYFFDWAFTVALKRPSSAETPLAFETGLDPRSQDAVQQITLAFWKVPVIRAQVWAFIRCDQFTYRKFLRHFYSTATHDQALDDAQTIPVHLRLLYASSKS